MLGEKYPWGRRPRYGLNGPLWTHMDPLRPQRTPTAPDGPDGPRRPLMAPDPGF